MSVKFPKHSILSSIGPKVNLPSKFNHKAYFLQDMISHITRRAYVQASLLPYQGLMTILTNLVVIFSWWFRFQCNSLLVTSCFLVANIDDFVHKHC